MIKSLDTLKQEDTARRQTALLYCQPGVGKSTMLGIIAEQSEGRTLILDVDRTIINTLSKGEVVKDTSRVDIMQIDNIDTWDSWEATLRVLQSLKQAGNFNYENICVDNISELERCILSSLGAKGKNKGVPSQGDYQYMQFKLVNSLRFLKQLGANIYLTAWEVTEQFTHPDGTQYSRLYPKVSAKIVDNICGLCDIVAKIHIRVNPETGESERIVVLDATQNIYAKNQIDDRKGCKASEFIKNKE